MSHRTLASCVLLWALACATASATTGRAVSVNALAKALKTGSAQAQSLCGITRVTGYLSDSAAKDVILIGEVDHSLPRLNANDFVVALRNAWLLYARTEGRVRYYSAPGCSIDPDPAVLRELQSLNSEQLASNDPDSKKTYADRWHSIGKRPQRVRVMGVPFDSRFARVMVDADYYMKRLVNGSVELGIRGFESLSSMNVRAARSAIASGKWDSMPKHTMSRFWFSPGESTYSEEDGVTLLESCSVRLLTEEEFLNSQGGVSGMGRPNPMAAQFARGFTTSYDAIASARPIYRELQGLFRFVALARLMKDAKAASKGLGYLLRSHRVPTTPVSRAVNGLTNVSEVSESTDTTEGTTVSTVWLTSCGGVSMDVRPKRVRRAATVSVTRSVEGASSGPGAKTPKPAVLSGSASRKSARPSAPVSLKKSILGARKTVGELSWDFPAR